MARKTRKDNTLLYLGIGAALLYFMQRGGAAISGALSLAGIPRLQIGGFVSTVLNLRIFLPIRSTLFTPVPIGLFTGALYYQSTFIANVFLTKPVSVDPNTITEVEVKGVIDLANLPAAIKQIFDQGQFWPNITLKGNLFYDIAGQRLSIPVSQTISLL